ncbi:Peroxisomal targeting signal type 2 receptor [Handroanthus impetiginosus]|uniref:Peroxisomal targeting signal type 2 receptor n=1 Tax=Handroanthus impetiginosus TaxID=429701 RepID=A0A2G9H4K6_9LAMI|nr:Peroxisomal targeting signal type 2 receptor [Handroanthus impetiginosus]
MDLSAHENNVCNFQGDQETRTTNLPRRFSFGANNDVIDHSSQISSPRTSCVSSSSLPFWTTSPETPWTRSPLSSSSPKPLLYHCLASLHRKEGNIFSLTITKDFIFAGSSSKRIHFWKQPDCNEMGFIKVNKGQIRSMLASGKLLITTHGDFRIRFWDLSSSSTSMKHFRPKKIMTLPQRTSFISYYRKVIKHKDAISCVAYNNLEHLLYTGSWDQTVKVWKLSEKRLIDSFLAHEGYVNAIVINQEDGCVFTCSSDGTIKLWRRVSKESSHVLTMTLRFQESPVNALALNLSPNGSFLYSGSSNGLINFWEKERISGRYNHGGFLQGHHFAVLCLVAIEDLILSGSEDSTIRIWKREEQGNCFHCCLAVIDGHHGPVKSLAAVFENGDFIRGLLVYSASLDQTLKVWRVKVCNGEKVKFDEIGKDKERLEGNLSPILSPSWVEKKIQGSI